MPSIEGGRGGWRFNQRAALPRQRVMAIRWNSCEVLMVESCGLARWAMDFPSVRTMWMKSSERPPRVSTTMGIKSIPAALQADKWEFNFLWVPTCRAWPGVVAASCRVASWSGDITWTSNAAGLPWYQDGRRTSAGLDWEFDIMLEASRIGPKAADCAAEKRTSLMALWRTMRSPFPPQPTWWSPNLSAVLWHSGQEYGELWSGTPSQYLKQHRNDWSGRWRPNVAEGRPFSQSPACGREVERARARARVDWVEERSCWKTASSTAEERRRWTIGMSISFRVCQSGREAEAERAGIAEARREEGSGAG